MSKKTWLILTALFALASAASLSQLAEAIGQRGFAKVNYGALIPVAAGVWCFVRFRRAK